MTSAPGGGGGGTRTKQIYSGAYVCGGARFKLIAYTAVIATQGICSAQITDKVQDVDTTAKLWIVVQATMEGHNQQVVVGPPEVMARCWKPRVVDHQGRWHTLCRRLRWGKRAAQYTKEVVRVHTK